MEQQYIIGIDLGGTNARAALVSKKDILKIVSAPINGSGTVEEVLQTVFDLTDSIIDTSIKGIGIGVPSVVEAGVVYDVQNIPSWKEVPLQALIQERYSLPVFVNNDANCFALGEFYYGKGRERNGMIGLAIGTGLGAGIIINKKLYAGANCGAGEFGMVAYLDKYYEYYASGQFFQNVYRQNGADVYKRAKAGDEAALKMYEELGHHLGSAIKMILYTYDPDLIVLGGSVRHAYPFFSKALWRTLETFAFSRSVQRLRIELSDLENSGVLGAAALYYDAQTDL